MPEGWSGSSSAGSNCRSARGFRTAATRNSTSNSSSPSTRTTIRPIWARVSRCSGLDSALRRPGPRAGAPRGRAATGLRRRPDCTQDEPTERVGTHHHVRRRIHPRDLLPVRAFTMPGCGPGTSGTSAATSAVRTTSGVIHVPVIAGRTITPDLNNLSTDCAFRPSQHTANPAASLWGEHPCRLSMTPRRSAGRDRPHLLPVPHAC